MKCICIYGVVCVGLLLGVGCDKPVVQHDDWEEPVANSPVEDGGAGGVASVQSPLTSEQKSALKAFKESPWRINLIHTSIDKPHARTLLRERSKDGVVEYSKALQMNAPIDLDGGKVRYSGELVDLYFDGSGDKAREEVSWHAEAFEGDVDHLLLEGDHVFELRSKADVVEVVTYDVHKDKQLNQKILFGVSEGVESYTCVPSPFLPELIGVHCQQRMKNKQTLYTRYALTAQDDEVLLEQEMDSKLQAALSDVGGKRKTSGMRVECFAKEDDKAKQIAARLSEKRGSYHMPWSGLCRYVGGDFEAVVDMANSVFVSKGKEVIYASLKTDKVPRLHVVDVVDGRYLIVSPGLLGGVSLSKKGSVVELQQELQEVYDSSFEGAYIIDMETWTELSFMGGEIRLRDLDDAYVK